MMLLESITLTYPDGDGRMTALDSVSLQVTQGEAVALTGPSGAGKSSVLAVASTLIRPDSGRVELDGIATNALSEAARARLRLTTLGIVFQQPNLIPSLTALEQLELLGKLGRQRKPRERALELLESVGLAGHERKRPAQLSGGQRQRVNIARALMGSPSVLLVDEPTSALDTARGAAITALLLQLTKEQSMAMLVVTHDERTFAAFDRVERIEDGRMCTQSAAVEA